MWMRPRVEFNAVQATDVVPNRLPPVACDAKMRFGAIPRTHGRSHLR